MNNVEHSMKYLIEITQKIFQKTKSKRRKKTEKIHRTQKRENCRITKIKHHSNNN